MFWMVAAILVFPWLLGLVISYSTGGHLPPAGARPGYQEGMMRETIKETSYELALSQRTVETGFKIAIATR